MASKKKKIRITICIAIILCFFIATIVFCILLKRAGTGITDFFKNRHGLELSLGDDYTVFPFKNLCSRKKAPVNRAGLKGKI